MAGWRGSGGLLRENQEEEEDVSMARIVEEAELLYPTTNGKDTERAPFSDTERATTKGREGSALGVRGKLPGEVEQRREVEAQTQREAHTTQDEGLNLLAQVPPGHASNNGKR